MNIKEFNKNMKNSKTIKIDLFSQTNTNWEANVKGEFKNQINENEKEKGFSNKQLSQLASLINEFVPPIVVNIIHQEVPKIINEQVPPIVETIVDQKLEPLIKEARNHGWNI